MKLCGYNDIKFVIKHNVEYEKNVIYNKMLKIITFRRYNTCSTPQCTEAGDNMSVKNNIKNLDPVLISFI